MRLPPGVPPLALAAAALLTLATAAPAWPDTSSLEGAWARQSGTFDGVRRERRSWKERERERLRAEDRRKYQRWMEDEQQRFKGEDSPRSTGALAQMGVAGLAAIAVGSTVKNPFWRDLLAVAIIAASILSLLLLAL